jgi:hypothetical protein
MSPGKLTRLAFLLGCAACSTQFVATNPYPHAPTPHPPSSVEVFSSGPPAREHVDVGVISMWGRGWDDYLHELRVEGSRRGCDAVVIGNRYATCVVYRDGGLPADNRWEKNAPTKPSVETNLGWDRPGPPEAFPVER